MPHHPHPADAEYLGRDELALPHFEERLWGELRDEHARGSAARPGVRRLRLGGSRRIRRSLSVVAAAAAVAAGAVVVATLVPVTSPDDRSATSVPPSGDESVPLETQVIGAIDEALENSVVHVAQDNTAYGDDEAWFDETTGAHRLLQTTSDGAPSYDSGMAVAPDLDDVAPDLPTSVLPADPDWPMQLARIVDYCFGEYVEVEMGALPGGSEAARIRDGLADGSLRIEGTEVIDGRELLSVVRVFPPPTDGPTWSQRGTSEEAITDTTPTTTADTVPAAPEAGPSPPTTAPGSDPNDPADLGTTPSEAPGSGGDWGEPDIRTYVDPESYRPVMVRGYVGSDAEYTQTITYLPRTPENLAQLVPPVPDGFVRATELHGDGERADAGCGF